MAKALNGAIVALADPHTIIHVERFLEEYTKHLVKIMDDGFAVQPPGPAARPVDVKATAFVISTVMRRVADGRARAAVFGPLQPEKMTYRVAIESAAKAWEQIFKWYRDNPITEPA